MQHKYPCRQFVGEREEEEGRRRRTGKGRRGSKKKKKKDPEKKFERKRETFQWPVRCKRQVEPQTAWSLRVECTAAGEPLGTRLLLSVVGRIRWVWLHDEERPCSVHFQQGNGGADVWASSVPGPAGQGISECRGSREEAAPLQHPPQSALRQRWDYRPHCTAKLFRNTLLLSRVGTYIITYLT